MDQARPRIGWVRPCHLTMEYITLANTDLKVSRICMGTVFRAEASDAVCLSTIEAAHAAGCNFIDCANVYREGYSESIVGRALKGRRAEFVVTTKVGAAPRDDPSGAGLSAACIMRQCESSLRRLGTDHIDLYLCHHPDPETPIEETLHAMADLRQQGKIRYAGCSNFEAWRLYEAKHAAELAGIPSFVCNSVQYNLLDRRIEDEILPYCQANNIEVTAFAPTAIGLLSGLFSAGSPPPTGTPWQHGPYNFRTAMTSGTAAVIDAAVKLARECGATPTQIAISWCLNRPGVAAVISGMDSPDQAVENCGAAKFSDAEMNLLDDVSDGMHLTIRKDCPEGYRD